MGDGNLATEDMLKGIGEYLNGLDNIIMARSSTGQTKEIFCDSPAYGKLIVAINKMMGTATDEDLENELMQHEPGIELLTKQ